MHLSTLLLHYCSMSLSGIHISLDFQCLDYLKQQEGTNTTGLNAPYPQTSTLRPPPNVWLQYSSTIHVSNNQLTLAHLVSYLRNCSDSTIFWSSMHVLCYPHPTTVAWVESPCPDNAVELAPCLNWFMSENHFLHRRTKNCWDSGGYCSLVCTVPLKIWFEILMLHTSWGGKKARQYNFILVKVSFIV